MILRKKPKNLWKCQDGTYSTHKRRGACNWHGGLKSDNPVNFSYGKRVEGIELIELSKIHVNHEWFQNRATPYSARSVANIVDAVTDKRFNWANFDAITLWKGPGGKLFVLSGHSRTEAFRQLCEAGFKVAGKNFCRIPAKIVQGLSLIEAKQMAQESNTLATKETPIERAEFYRKMRAEGATNKEILDRAKRLEGRNARTVIAFSYLASNGQTMNALQMLENGQEDSKQTINSIARWIGNARQQHTKLTDYHENELYNWLVTNRGYGKQRGQVSRETEFKSRLESIINRRTDFGVLLPSLNIQNHISKSPVERQYDQRLEEARDEVKKADKDLQAKIVELANREASPAQIDRITAPLERTLRQRRLTYQNLLQKQSEVSNAARNELNLFASLGGINICI